MHTQLSSGVVGLNFGPSLHLHPFCVQDVKAGQTEPLLLSYEIGMEMFRHLLFYVYQVVTNAQIGIPEGVV